MPATGRDLHIDVPLSNVAMNYRPMNMIADVVAPIVPVAKQSDAYIIYSQADALRVEPDKRAPGDEAKKVLRSVSSDTYFAQNYALKTPLTLEDRENMDAALIGEMRNGKAKWLKGKVAINWEKRLANKVTSGTNVGSYSTVASDWIELRSGYSDPLGNLWTAMYNVQDSTGYKANRCIIGDVAWRYLRRHADIVDILHGDSGAGQVRYASEKQMSDILGLDTFQVGAAYYNSGAEGQSNTLSTMWGDYVLLYYAPSSPSMDEPSFMYSFRWQKPAIPNMAVEVHPFNSRTKSEEIEIGYYQDEKITSSALGFLLTHVTSV